MRPDLFATPEANVSVIASSSSKPLSIASRWVSWKSSVCRTSPRASMRRSSIRSSVNAPNTGPDMLKIIAAETAR